MERLDAIESGKPNREAATRSPFGFQPGWLNLPVRDASRALFVPLHYEPNYAYPLIVWLHGPGSDERELFEIMPQISRRNYAGVAPRGFRVRAEDSGEEIWGWSEAWEHVQEAQERVFRSVDLARRRLHIAPRGVFLAGLGAGGTMAFRVAMSYPDRFAGVLSLGGAFPVGQTPLSHWTQARNLTVFLAIGRVGHTYTPARACEDLRLFHAAGISVTLRQYPWAPLLTGQVLGDMDRWIMEQIASRPACAVLSSDRSPCAPD